MNLGIDCGASTVKLALMEKDRLVFSWKRKHCGQPLRCAAEALKESAHILPKSFGLALTGCCAHSLLPLLPGAAFCEEIPSIIAGSRLLAPDAGSIIEIGSQSSRFITDLHKVPQFSVNEHCAGGTGSFFEDQMSRLNLSIEDYSALAEQAAGIPRLSGRCSVFAKTDIIHRQQEGVSTPDILLGLCYAMIRNYKAVIVRTLPIQTPVLFCGGVTQNAGVIRAIPDVFHLNPEELIVPSEACFESAIGAALNASGDFSALQIVQLLSSAAQKKRSTRLCVFHCQFRTVFVRSRLWRPAFFRRTDAHLELISALPAQILFLSDAMAHLSITSTCAHPGIRKPP
ncbi:MAG: hypothetical protein LUG93_03090 [Lachnospiraceae bacterium]|nr:hypothetical protein [Lachnospiraceae bacterium]